MNYNFYNNLLIYANKLIRNYPSLTLNKFDLVHENWDFKSENKKEVINKIANYFYDELKSRCIPFSKFKHVDGTAIPPELIVSKPQFEHQEKT